MLTSPSPLLPGKRVRLHFECKNLADLDTFSKSDPYLVLYIADGPQAQPAHRAHPARSRFGREVGRTETIMNNLNPCFMQPVEINFLFECRQQLTAVVYDFDGSHDDARNDLCGIASFQLSYVICSAQGRKEFPLITPAGVEKGSVVISYSEVSSCSSRCTLRLGLRGENLIKMGVVGNNSPYFVISRLQPNGTKLEVYRSEVCSSNNSPRWAITSQLQQVRLFSSSRDEETIAIDVFTRGFMGDTGLGSYKCSLSSLEALCKSKAPFALRKAKNPSKHYGDVYVDVFDVVEFPTFAQSLSSGRKIDLALSIDFTGSNGDPRSPHSLHFMNPSAPNQYVSAIVSVGDILMEYSSSKKIPVLGFGASIRGVTSHLFNVTQTHDPYVLGVQGALDAYGAFLPAVTLSGPTFFAPTIRAVTASAYQAPNAYTILLIITDGEINDMADTVDALVEADDAPLSIVIVGVGTQCDFKMMEELDGDNVRLRSRKGRVSRRDLVQFVAYRDFLPPKPREALAAEVLREIPEQFEEYLALQAQSNATLRQFENAFGRN